MESENQQSSNTAEHLSLQCDLSYMLNDEDVLPFLSFQPSICPVDYDSTLQMLENKLAENNHDRFIDLS